MRLFTAVTLGTAVEERAAAGIERLRALAPRARWVNPEGVHLTLVFLGEVAEARLAQVSEVLTPVAAHHAPFHLAIEGGGVFGLPSHPNVLWAAVRQDTAALEALQAEVATVLEPLGFERERRMYTAHLTLARSREPRGEPAFVACQEALAREHWGQARVEQLILFESKAGRYVRRLELALSATRPEEQTP